MANLLNKKIIDLYIKSKLSMKQIAVRLDISDSAVLYCLDKNNIKRRSLSEAIINLNQIKFNKKPFKLKESLSDFDKNLKIAGVMLYLGEGAKTGNTVKFVNSDPEIIKIFLNFLRRICGIHEERLKALIHYYPDQDEKFLKRFWSSEAKIFLGNFCKSYIHNGKRGSYKSRSSYGTLALSYSDKRLLEAIILWIKEYKNKLI